MALWSKRTTPAASEQVTKSRTEDGSGDGGSELEILVREIGERRVAIEAFFTEVKAAPHGRINPIELFRREAEAINWTVLNAVEPYENECIIIPALRKLHILVDTSQILHYTLRVNKTGNYIYIDPTCGKIMLRSSPDGTALTSVKEIKFTAPNDPRAQGTNVVVCLLASNGYFFEYDGDTDGIGEVTTVRVTEESVKAKTKTWLTEFFPSGSSDLLFKPYINPNPKAVYIRGTDESDKPLEVTKDRNVRNLILDRVGSVYTQ